MAEQKTVFDRPDDVLATAAKLLEGEGLLQAASVLRSAQASFEKIGYDNWNGGTDIYTLWLCLPADAYARLGDGRERVEQQVTERLRPVMAQFTEDWFGAKVVPLLQRDPEWRCTASGVTRATRSEVFDYFRVSGTGWWGALDEVEFLARLYDLDGLPSADSRFRTAAGDIRQHRVNNPLDWPDDWVFTDSRFGLLDGSDALFLKFLCETVHPVVRRDGAENTRLVQQLNTLLRRDGWHLAEEEPIAGRPRYVARRLGTGVARSAARARTAADVLDAGWMHKEIQRLEGAVESDPSLAIGTAKDLVETCCKTILARRRVEVPKGADLPKLVRLVAKELKLVPDDVSETAKGADTIRAILGNLASLTQGLAELRGLYGSGHGRDGRYRGLGPRHARLAVGAAVAFIDFVTETFHDRVPREQSGVDEQGKRPAAEAKQS